MAKGVPATAKQKAAASKNSKKANAARAERAAERKAARIAARANGAVVKPRWQQLEDGDITVKDLTMDELIKGEVTNADGTREGKRHPFDVKWLNKMNNERVLRIRKGIAVLAQPALDAIEEMINDADNPSQRAAMSKMVIEYEIGKVPEVIHVGQETEWDRMTQGAYVIQRGVDAVQVDEDSEEQPPQIVRGEVLEEK